MQNSDWYKYVNTAAIDVVFCMDGSGSAQDVRESGKSVVEMAKQRLKNIYSDFSDACFERGRNLEQFRVRIIVFRDYLADGEHAMMVTDFA